MNGKRHSRIGLVVTQYITILFLVGLLTLPLAWSGAPEQPNSITNLYDAFGYGKHGTTLDWGYSTLIHFNGKTILFDAGNRTDVFEHNVKALGVDLSKVDIAVLSH